MQLHIIGVCGTFMGGLAVLARQLGHSVTGSDQNVYPPMSLQLEAQHIALMQGFRAENLDPRPDLVIIGNALSRGNAEVEAVLERRLPYISGPQWLLEHVLQDRHVLAVAGTHGKTTTASMLAWILEHHGDDPGFLIGGVPINFGVSARLGQGRCFVVEADEYDTAFFDKRSKFVHYRPQTLVLNNLEYDHADIFPDLAAIEQQFHHLLRRVPRNGRIVLPTAEPALDRVLARGCWTPIEKVQLGQGACAAGDEPARWQTKLLSADGCSFEVFDQGRVMGQVAWELTGQHNVKNALAAIAAAQHVGVPPPQAIAALSTFRHVKRRLEIRGCIADVTLYDDFAHHPTAIATTLAGLRAHVGAARIIAVLEPRSRTMKLGVHADTLADSLQSADRVLLFAPDDLGWDLRQTAAALPQAEVFSRVEAIVECLSAQAQAGDHVVFMSNGGFGAIHQRTAEALTLRSKQRGGISLP